MRVYEAKMVYSLISLGEEVRLDKPAKVADYLRSAFEKNPMQEAFYCVHLDRKNHPLGRQLITLGTATSTLVSPKEVFRGAILSGAVAIVVAHNHPSGDPGPSQADLSVTRALREAARILEIELLDHVVVGDAKSDPQGRGYFSFEEAGHL
ncbi:MAG: JAB domain-containing protein [Opitutaceae bacterium]|nr:JAB domain-containing protein [Opitutaceae bacterium]